MELGAIWWHLGTGKWIFHNLGIPLTDPFTFTADPAVDNTFVLTAFWLCQVLFYLIHLAGGLYGLIAFKAALFTASAFVLWKTARAQGAPPVASYLCVVPSIFIFVFYDEIRPQTLSLLFFSITIYILERARLRRNTPGVSTGRGPLWLVALMVLWSNMHPGFVIGTAFILLYMAEHVISYFVSPGRRKGIDPLFLFSMAAALSISALNPNGLEAVRKTLHMFIGSAQGVAIVHEHLGVREFAEFTGSSAHLATVAVLAGGGLLSLAVRFRNADIFQAFIFCSMAAFAYITFRAGLFFAVAAVPMLGRNLSGLNITLGPRTIRTALISSVSLAIISTVLLGAGRSIISRPLTPHGLLPENAANHIARAGLPARLYHPYEWGGYLSWRLFPQYKTFIDSRGLYPLEKHLKIKNARPGWDEMLESWGVNTVVFWALLPYEKRVPPVVFALIRDPGWDAVYWDTMSLVFVRAGMEERRLKDRTVWELLESLVVRNISVEGESAANHIALAEIYMNRGLPSKALSALENAMAIEPGNLEARKLLGHLRSSGSRL